MDAGFALPGDADLEIGVPNGRCRPGGRRSWSRRSACSGVFFERSAIGAGFALPGDAGLEAGAPNDAGLEAGAPRAMPVWRTGFLDGGGAVLTAAGFLAVSDSMRGSL